VITLIDLEAVEKLEELLGKTEDILTSFEKVKEESGQADVQALLDKVTKAQTAEEKDAVLKEVAEFLKKLLSYYPYPYYPYPYYPAPASTSSSSAEDTQNETVSSQEEKHEDNEELESLKKENSELKSKIEELERELVLKDRESKLRELSLEGWDNMRNVIAKMTDEEFDTFLKTLSQEKHSAVPETEVKKGNIFERMREEVKGGDK